jgi:trans-aconitate 2-methyltransferase
MIAIDWDAGAYDRISDMQLESGREFLAGVSLRGDETAIDAGCGTGRVTRRLAERLARGSVIGVDVSEAMIALSRANLDPSTAHFLHMNLTARRPLRQDGDG